jgi:hypothetical protein
MYRLTSTNRTDTDLSNLVFVSTSQAPDDASASLSQTLSDFVPNPSTSKSSHTATSSTRYQGRSTSVRSQAESRRKSYAATPSKPLPAIPREECIVCGEEPTHLPRYPPTKKCTHKSEVCLDCLRKTIEVAVEDQNFGGENSSGIRCPTINCTQWMDHADVRYWANSAVFDR